jgi:hypothetical protein
MMTVADRNGMWGSLQDTILPYGRFRAATVMERTSVFNGWRRCPLPYGRGSETLRVCEFHSVTNLFFSHLLMERTSA